LELSDYIKDNAIAWGIGSADVNEIDEHNILNATMLAMHRALDSVYQQIEFENIVVDGNRFKTYMSPSGDFIPHQCIIGGDGSQLGIAAASIVAKVHRDTCVEEIAKEFPQYKWDKNKGYGTKDHIDALMQYGPTKYHRLSFKPVAESARIHKYER
jgi:ribonuclease HII